MWLSEFYCGSMQELKGVQLTEVKTVYRTKKHISTIIMQLPLLSFLAFGIYISYGIKIFVPTLFLMGLWLFWLYNRKIVLDNTTVHVINSFKRNEVKYGKINGLRVGCHKSRFSPVSVPVLTITVGEHEQIPIFILAYSNSDIANVVNTIIERNPNVQISEEVNQLLKLEDSSTLKEFKGDFNISHRIGLIGAAIALLIYIVYYLVKL